MITAYTSTPLDYFIDPVSFDPGGPSNLTGATVRVDAIRRQSFGKVAGTAAIVSATSIRCTFPAGSLSVGDWEVQCLVTVGGLSQILEEPLQVRVKAGAAPG